MSSNSARRKRKMRRPSFNMQKLERRPEVGIPLKTSLLALFALAGSVGAVLFLRGANYLYSNIYPALATQSPVFFLVGSFVAITLTALLVSYLLVVLMPSASGSGIPQVKAAYRNQNGSLPFKSTVVRFLANMIGLGGGFSLGSEGPTVYIGASIAANCAEVAHVIPRRRKIICAAGAGAGLAAAFNTPIASVIFIIEELVDRLNPRQMGGLLMACVIGACTSWFFVGRHPAFSVPTPQGVSTIAIVLTPIVALVAAVVGRWFQSRTLATRQKVRQWKKIPPWMRPLVGGWCVWILGASVFLVSGRLGVFSFGYDDLRAALNGEITWYVALLILLAKLLATIIAYATAGCGGVFAPSLFFGTMVGFSIAGLAKALGAPIGPQGILLLSLIGMSSCFGALDRAPLTAVLIVFEMTGCYEIIPALMIGTVVSQSYSYYFSDKVSFYDAILRQDGITLLGDGERPRIPHSEPEEPRHDP